jgi:low affinity Fe/Cu permease
VSFAGLAASVSRAAGTHYAFILALAVVVAWIVTGPLFGFSDTWQLVINTGTTIVTFLMVFLIQATQNRDTTALHLKLDELIRVNERARNAFIGIERRETGPAN